MPTGMIQENKDRNTEAILGQLARVSADRHDPGEQGSKLLGAFHDERSYQQPTGMIQENKDRNSKDPAFNPNPANRRQA